MTTGIEDYTDDEVAAECLRRGLTVEDKDEEAVIRKAVKVVRACDALDAAIEVVEDQNARKPSSKRVEKLEAAFNAAMEELSQVVEALQARRDEERLRRPRRSKGKGEESKADPLDTVRTGIQLGLMIKDALPGLFGGKTTAKGPKVRSSREDEDIIDGEIVE